MKIKCCECGRFIGPDGRIDIALDEYTGAWEEGYSYCGRCWRELEGRNENPVVRENGVGPGGA